MAVAALAIVAVAAAMLLAGGNPAPAGAASAPSEANTHSAQPQTGPPSGGDPTPEPTPTPRVHATPEPCPGETGNPNTDPASVVDSGHIALFDVWWNDDEGELTNSSCPPIVAYDPATRSTQRSPSSIDIAETVIHIPSTAKVTLSESNYPKVQYQALWDADDKENPDGDGDRVVWELPACPPTGSPADNGLCISFSAALLNSADWDGDIVYHVDHVHQVDIDKQDHRYVLAYDSATDVKQPRWNSSDARESEMPVGAGKYNRPTWFFTSRGTYEFQVHITGEPEQDSTLLGGLKPLGTEESVSGDVRDYILHVGAEADLGVGMTVVPADRTDPSLAPGDDVTITVTASNVGPDTAPVTEVDVTLPQGLTYSSHVAATGTSYDSTAGVWTIGSFDKDASKTLTITATLDAGTRGQELTTTATISATETLQLTETVDGEAVEQTYHVPVADPVSDNNRATGAVTVVSIANEDPMFRITGSIAENSAAGTAVVSPVLVRDPDDSLHNFTIKGTGAGKFQVDTAGNVTVAQGADLDYECRANYNLTLRVSDGRDADGNADTQIDDVLGLDITLSDVDDDVIVTIASDHSTLQAGNSIRLTATTSKGPPCGEWHGYQWREKDPSTADSWSIKGSIGLETIYNHTTAGTRAYQLSLGYRDANGVDHSYTSNIIEVTWTE